MKQITLQEAVQNKLHKKLDFLRLESYDQRLVLKYLEDNKIDIKVLGKRWFDILKQSFFVERFTYVDYEEGDIKSIQQFDSFDDFYKYVDGDIYSHSCYYGFIFDEETIKKYKIDIKRINTKAFINETINRYTFDNVKEKKEDSDKPSRDKAKAMMEWIDSCPAFKTVKELRTDNNAFLRKFSVFGANEVYFSTLLRKKKDEIKEVVIKYICEEGTTFGFSIDDILVHYGRESAQRVVDNYVGQQSYNTTRKRIREFNKVLEGYDHGPNELKRKIWFSEDTQLYIVSDEYLNGEFFSVLERYFFYDFDELAEFLNKDLSDADLSKAPVSREKIAQCKTNEKTAFPPSETYEEYTVTKRYDKNHFVVIQRWLDSDKNVVQKKVHSFNYIFDFIYFLRKDLTDADFIMCEGAGNLAKINNLKLDGIKVRSEAAKELKSPIRYIPEDCFKTTSFEQPQQYELATIDSFIAKRGEEDVRGSISYITDIHLLHRFETFGAISKEDCTYVTRDIAIKINDESTKLCLIGGDTSSDFEAFKVFVTNLRQYNTKDNYYFFTLGNHELWPFVGQSFDSMVQEYRDVLSKHKMYLLQNSIIYLSCRKFKEITEDELASTTSSNLREKLRDANLIVFGGLAFSGQNKMFNSDMGIYRGAISREEEIKQSEKFLKLYNKVVESLYGKNVVIFTHTPISDWGGNIKPQEGFIYVNGHNHRNYFEDDGKTRIYADNQVGYKGKTVSLKTISANYNYDWFADYKDGIYEITKKDYENFYRGIGEPLTFNRQFLKLFMIKRDGNYMFFIQSTEKSIQILNGGSIRSAGKHPLEYFYENLSKYNSSINAFLSQYYNFQKTIAQEIKKIGGTGIIHGCIIDIDALNHLYVNPLDGKVVPYYALSIIDKYVYSNLPSLLKYECPSIYKKYEQLTMQTKGSNELTIYNSKEKISDKKVYVSSTEIYRVSRIIKGLQYVIKYNVVRIWSDEFLEKSSEENGKLIVSSIINPK